MELRPYQKNAVAAILGAPRSGNFIVSLPTGSGKSLVIAEVVRRLASPTLIFQPSREILEQNVEKLLRHVPREDIGIFSASAGEKSIAKFTFATIGSVYRKPELFEQFSLVLLDECHLLSPKDTGTMFRTFLNAIGDPRVIGLTATPWRQDQAWKDWGLPTARPYMTTKALPRMGNPAFWQDILFHVSLGDLTEAGYLCPIHYFSNSSVSHSTLATNKSATDFDLDAYEELIREDEGKILDAVVRAGNISHSVLVFCSSVAQAERFASVVKGSAVVSANTNAKERERIVSSFKTGATKIVFNVGVFTTGFDSPALDTVVLVRPTRSIGLYLQMVGRVVRNAPGKKEARVIDFSGTVRELGRAETFRMEKSPRWDIVSEKGRWHGRELYDLKLIRNNVFL